MARTHEVIHHLRQKPEHVRENIAIALSGGVTLVVALGWLATNITAGTFSLSSATFASADPNVHQTVAETKSNFSDLLGAAGAAIGATTSPTTITIVDTEVHSTFDEPQVPADATVIHF